MILLVIISIALLIISIKADSLQQFKRISHTASNALVKSSNHVKHVSHGVRRLTLFSTGSQHGHSGSCNHSCSSSRSCSSSSHSCSSSFDDCKLFSMWVDLWFIKSLQNFIIGRSFKMFLKRANKFKV